MLGVRSLDLQLLKINNCFQLLLSIEKERNQVAIITMPIVTMSTSNK